MKHRVLCHIVPAPACLVKIIVVIVTPYNVDAGGKAGVIKTILVLSRIYKQHLSVSCEWYYSCPCWTTWALAVFLSRLDHHTILRTNGCHHTQDYGVNLFSIQYDSTRIFTKVYKLKFLHMLTYLSLQYKGSICDFFSVAEWGFLREKDRKGH